MLMLCGCSVVSAFAQSMDSLFVHIPNEVLPMLVRNTRLDMLDLYNCGMKAEVENDFGGRACLLQKDSVHLLVQTSNVSRLELRVLPSDGDTLLGCVRTVETPAAYSQVQFFTRNWKPVRSPLSDEVAFSACWKPAEDFSDDRKEELRRALLPARYLVSWQQSAEGQPVLCYEVSVTVLMSKDAEDARRCLKPAKWVWQKKKLVRLED